MMLMYNMYCGCSDMGVREDKKIEHHVLQLLEVRVPRVLPLIMATPVELVCVAIQCV